MVGLAHEDALLDQRRRESLPLARLLVQKVRLWFGVRDLGLGVRDQGSRSLEVYVLTLGEAPTRPSPRSESRPAEVPRP